MVHSQSVAVQNKRKTRRESIRSVSHLQKRDQCQKAKEDLPLQGNGPLPMWDQNQLTLQHLQKEKIMAGPGLYANIHAKRKRGGKMRKKGAKGAPTAANFRRAAQTARKR